ncbi:MAG: hypothetical protein WCR02_03725 [Sphaerochaetaceae bacterium]
MKKRLFAVSLLATIGLLFISCQSTVVVRHLEPALVDLSDYRTLAIASTTVNANGIGNYSPWINGFDDFGYRFSTGYERDTAEIAAKTASATLTQTLQNSGFFTVLPPSDTDNYLGIGLDGLTLLINKGVKAIVNSSISYMDLDEHSYTEDITEYKTDPVTHKSIKTVVGRKRYISQTVTLTLTYVIKDIRTGSVLTSNSYTGKKSRDTLVDTRMYTGATSSNFVEDRIYSYTYAPSVTDMTKAIITSFQSDIAHQLSPTWKVQTIALMDNKPKDANVEGAYKLADQGSVEAAYRLFSSNWQATGHVPSGFNAALMLEAMGKLDDAVSLMNKVSLVTYEPRVFSELSRMLNAQKQQAAAENQITGTSPAGEAGMTTTQIITVK